jgi:diaminopimelate decarboxylase
MLLQNSVLDFINNHTKKEFDPYYIYDSTVIREHCQLFRNINYQNKSIHFATMANINLQFLKIVNEEKINVFVNSILHLQVALKAGFRNHQIIFTSSALTEKTMQMVRSCGVLLYLDSPMQLQRWKKLFPGESVGIRCNIGDKVIPYSTHAGFFIGTESRLGFTINEIEAISDKSLISGLHVYAGTDIFDVDYFLNCYRELLVIAEIFPALETINFGGGFGVSEDGKRQFNFSLYNTLVSQLMQDFSNKRNSPVKLILEPGRIIGGQSGYFVSTVTDIKKHSDNNWIGLNASVVQFSRPLLYPETAKHPVTIIRNGQQIEGDNLQRTNIFGCSTYSRDLFTKGMQLPELQIGDIVVFGNAGSYCASSYTEFLGFPKPSEYFI